MYNFRTSFLIITLAVLSCSKESKNQDVASSNESTDMNLEKQLLVKQLNGGVGT